MKSDRPVAIVGGGFSGTIVAAQLARRGIDSVLIDGSGSVGRGVAYSTREPAHLLNVRAESMSAWADEPDHFARRFAEQGGDPRGFAQRLFFGSYLDGILADAIATGHVATLEGTAETAERDEDGYRLSLSDRREIAARALVLATGNQPPEMLAAFRGCGARFVADPWRGAAQAAVADLAERGGDVLLIGTGLTMVDLALSLDAAGHRGKAIALSRRGLAPRGHAEFAAAPVELDEVPLGSTRALLRWLRSRGARVGWRAAVDSLRPHSQALWQALDGAEQQRFLRHARPWWDVHRHRIAPDVADTIARMIAEGRLEVLAGRVVAAREAGEGLEVDVRRRGAAAAVTMRVDYAINCTGPMHVIERTRDPLLRSLLDGGQVRPDHLGIGLDVDDRSRAAGGEPLWAIGPLTKGRHWETIAVPDIRGQAAEIAADIEQEAKR